MKLLCEYASQPDAEALSLKLREKGILTYVSARHSRSLSSLYTGAVSSGVWVVLDVQYKDAIALLRSDHHKVENPLTESEMQELEQATKAASFSAINHYANKALAVLVLAAIVAFALYVVYASSAA